MRRVVDKPALLELPHHARDPRMRVLNVVHRVVVRAGGGELQVEVQMLVVAAHDVEQPRRIIAYFIAQVAQCDELARAGRHLRLFTAAKQRHELHEAHLEGIRGAAQRHQTCAQASDIAVMIGTPDIEQMIEASSKLVEYIGDIRRKVRLDAVFAHHHAVLFVAVVRALEPPGAVLQIGVSCCLQCVERPVDGAVVAQMSLGEPAVEGDAEFLQVFADVVQDAGQRQIQHAAKRRVPDEKPRPGDHCVDVNVLVASLRLIRRQFREDLGGALAQLRAFHGEQLLGNRHNVVAAVAVRGKRETLAAVLEISQPGADRQNFHLAARIVDVVLALHAVAHCLEQIRDGRAERGMPAMTDVQRARRIR